MKEAEMNSDQTATSQSYAQSVTRDEADLGTGISLLSLVRTELIEGEVATGQLWAHFYRLLAVGLEEEWIVPSQALALIADVGAARVAKTHG